MGNAEQTNIKLIVDDEQSLYVSFSPEDEFSDSVKSYIRSKLSDGMHSRQGIDMTVISRKPIDEERFRSAVSNWIRDEKVLFKTAEKLTIYSLIGLLVFGSVMLILSLTLSEYNDVLKYSLLPIIGSISLSKAAGILCFEMPAMTAQKLRFNKMEKYNVITFVYDNDCKKEQPAPLCSEDMVK